MHPEPRTLFFLIFFFLLSYLSIHTCSFVRMKILSPAFTKHSTVLMLMGFSFFSAVCLLLRAVLPTFTPYGETVKRFGNKHPTEMRHTQHRASKGFGRASKLSSCDSHWLNECLLRGARRDSLASSLQLSIYKEIQRNFYQGYH